MLPAKGLDRGKFLWNQQRYLIENIKMSDTKAGFVMTLAAALLSASFSPGGRASLHLAQSGGGPKGLAGAVFAGAGICSLVGAVLASAWSIKPRIRSHNNPSPVSWVNVAQYPDAASFCEASRALTEETSEEYLAEQVFYMSCICVTKHRLVAKGILAALCGGLLLAISTIVR
jgi:hypothetical protein